MKVAVTIPWRPTPDREEAFRFVWNWYVDHWFKNIDRIMAVDSRHTEFNRAASRNACVRAVADCDVVVINDADTVPTDQALDAAIAQAANGKLHYGLDKMKYLTEDETTRYLAGERVDVSDAKPHDSSVIVCTPATWWRVGGMDERFTGYGGEDGALCSAANAICGVQWHKGTAVSLYHDPMVRDIGSERWKPNSELSQRYYRARHNPAMILELIAERDY